MGASPKEWHLHDHPAVRALLDRVDEECRAKLVRLFSRCRLTESGCIEWQGARKDNGYGVISFKGERNVYVHRFVCAAAGHDLTDRHACHQCDNPPCAHPEHLWPGTAADNAHDAMAKGRHSPPPVTDWPTVMRTKPHHWQKLSIEDIPTIRCRLAAGETCKSIGGDFSVHENTIWNIKAGKRWAHVA